VTLSRRGSSPRSVRSVGDRNGRKPGGAAFRYAPDADFSGGGSALPAASSSSHLPCSSTRNKWVSCGQSTEIGRPCAGKRQP
jgi:hypothetical protein